MYFLTIQLLYANRYIFFVSEVLYDLEESRKITNMILYFTNYTFQSQDVVYINDYLHVLYVPIQNLYNASYNRLAASPHPELLETLIAYIEHNLNVSDAADALYIHRNTLLYRLGKIRDMYGIRTNRYTELMNLYLYYKTLTL